ncbi:protein translocase subunit SecD [Nocardioides ferulae]|uniref:protein translocase subunit SecD n=1 Tax=Nocardioides ferulae TaxID=2340821 RepID=UPI000EB4B0C7|nr:protein translocase subunit SecD [Nocardioides ferulae]
MAAKGYRPGRVLIFFFVGVILSYVLVAMNGVWKPQLGLDLQGGTRITLTATGDVTEENLEEAADIIDQRVNARGVSESEVTTQSGEYIVVEIPGQSRRDLLETVERQAQLRFRLVACSPSSNRCGTAAPEVQIPQGDGQGPLAPGDDSQAGQDGGKAGEKGDGKNGGQNGGQNGGNNRPPLAWADDATAAASDDASPTAEPTDGATAEPTDGESADSASESPSESPTVVEAPDAGDGGNLADKPLEWYLNPDPAAIKAYNEFQCPADGTAPVVEDDPDKPIVTCGEEGEKYLLSPAVVEGTDLDDASALIPPQELAWIVSLEFDGDGADKFGKVSEALYGTDDQFAIVLDGQVISAPRMNGLILDGRAQITGDFSQAEAESLATSLKFGALPIAFEDDPTSETIGPSLAGDQLTAGLWAGGFGLGLVMLYCLIYYRGLGIVVLGSLGVAAIVTYSMVLLLSEAAGFTLTLPGIAGLIIAVGVTADSFILFFERIRDEMREGKSMRVAVESGWRRAKVTRLAANTVSLLSATILYVFATGVVKGFGFALGLSTLIDLAVLFWFTRPAVSYLSKYRFFNGGGKLSGLSPETLGMDRVPAGGKA